VAGLNELSARFYCQLAKEYAVKRDRLCQALERAGLPPCSPQGAYYILANVSRLPGNDSKDRAMNLLFRTGVATVPGSAFFHGPHGESFVRFCYAKSDDELSEACQRLASLD
jgi:aminotransferase